MFVSNELYKEAILTGKDALAGRLRLKNNADRTSSN